MIDQYESNKKAKVGDTIVCPSCGKPFKKKSYQQAFCRNKGRNNCKDHYHNRASEKRLARAIALNSDPDTDWNEDRYDPWHEPDFNPMTGD